MFVERHGEPLRILSLLLHVTGVTDPCNSPPTGFTSESLQQLSGSHPDRAAPADHSEALSLWSHPAERPPGRTLGAWRWTLAARAAAPRAAGPRACRGVEDLNAMIGSLERLEGQSGGKLGGGV